MTCRQIALRPGWLSPDDIEPTLKQCDGVRQAGEESVLHFTRDTALLATTGLRSLAYLNQWAAQVDVPPPKLVFENMALFRYLDRNGYLTCLDPRIETDPLRPARSASVAMRGAASTVVEVVLIPAGEAAEVSRSVVGEMTDKVMRAVHGLSDELRKRMSNRLWGALAELIDNVPLHSETRLPGYATLQVYPTTKTVQAVVCDSGVGIPATLRAGTSASSAGFTDEQLLQFAIERGMSRRGTSQPTGYGCGFRMIRELVTQVGGKIEVRVPTMEFRSDTPPSSSVSPSQIQGHVVNRDANLDGTHLGLELRLDSPGWGA
jgi:hypothetical protein